MQKKKLTSLSDIAGYDKVKKEAAKLIDLLKNYDKYKVEGAFIPKGLLVSGEPGIGKTLLARAIIDQSELPYYVFDGTKSYDPDKTTRYMKETFDEAKKNTPCILFIDELDQLVSKHGFGEFKSDATEAFTKLMMTEMDGLLNSEGVFVICTTNDIEALPDAVLRSGRMDKKISLKAPNSKERELIIKHYTDGNPRFSEIHINDLIKITSGFTGADLKTAINEALIEAIHNGVKVSDTLLARKFDEIRFASIEQSSDEIDERIVYHELGHAIVHYKLFNEYTQISVESMGNTEGAVVPTSSVQEKAVKTFSEIKNNIIVSVGGLAAEEHFLKDGSLGSEHDISHMKALFLHLVKSGCYGFDLLRPMSTPWGVSDEPNEKYLALQNKVLGDAKAKAASIIKECEGLMEYMKPILTSKLRISPKEFEEIVKDYEKSLLSCPEKDTSKKDKNPLAEDAKLYEEIKKAVLEREYCSIAFIQRNFAIGFPKAGRIFSQLQDDGIVDTVAESAAKGCKVLNYNAKNN